MEGAVEIDDSLYSRQRYMLGDNAMKKMAQSSVLLIGCGAVGVEVAKNLVLTGIKTLTISDSTVCSVVDTGTNFYITEKDVEKGITRAEACVRKLAELNSYVDVSINDVDKSLKVMNEDSAGKLLNLYHCIVLTECSLKTQLFVNKFCRRQSPMIKMIVADVHGLFSCLFCDFGNDFEVTDIDGEEAKEVFISNVSQSNPGIVTCMEFHRHGLSNGDEIVFREVEGMTELNGNVYKVKYESPDEFSIGDTTKFSKYKSGGICTQIKAKNVIQFEPLESQLRAPSLSTPDLGKLEYPVIIHGSMLALHKFVEAHGRLPRTWDEEDATKMFKFIEQVLKELNGHCQNEELLERICRLLSYTCRGNLHPLSAAIGGVAAQEVLKAITGKYTPLQQWLYLDATELIDGLEVKQDSNEKVDRYTSLRSCIGDAALSRLHNTRTFMVGCGAIGCEMLKNLAMLGVSTDARGKVVLTDNDIIEKSNLNRQFLFRSQHIQKPKSDVAGSVITKINPGMRIESLQHKICHETESDVFTDAFFRDVDIVVNALDNVDARKYVDTRCVSNQLPLVESGTMGAKGHVQIIVPHLTESYGSQNDPVENEVPYCTLKSFPQQIEHTIQWARDKFENIFTRKPESFNALWKTTSADVNSSDVRDMVDRIIARVKSFEKVDGLPYAIRTLSKTPASWKDCCAMARHKFEKYFNHTAKQLLHAFPIDSKMEDGRDFWIAPKRPPHPLMFDRHDATHFMFITSMASLIARIHSVHVPPATSSEWMQGINDGLSVPVAEFIPVDKQIETDENVTSTQENDSDATISDDDATKQAQTLQGLLDEGKITRTTLEVEQFEKDDDSNHHIDFITSASNLRAMMYNIHPVDRLKTKKIAGRIVPAISTTTSAVAGIATIQFLQLIMQRERSNTISMYKNCFLNLALPLIVFSEPAEAIKTKITKDLHFTLWDIWEVHGNAEFTLSDFIDHFKVKYNLRVGMVIHGVRMVYVPSMPGHNKRLPHLMSKLIKSSKDYIDLTISFESEDADDDDDLNSPPIRYYFR